MDKTLELLKLAKDGDKVAKDKLVESNVGLVWSIARRFVNRGYDIDDIYQLGCIGLIKAIDKFDFSFEVKFSTYAVPMITGEIKRFLRDDGMIKISRSLKELAYKISVTKDMYMKEYNREPSIQDIARKLNVDEEEIVMALEANKDVESIYKTVYEGENENVYLIDKLACTVDESQKVVDRTALVEAIDKLDETMKNIIVYRYFNDKTQSYVSDKLGISQVQVSRLEKKALAHLLQLLVYLSFRKM